MKYLPRFEYVVPRTIAELCVFLQQQSESPRIVAGGTDLLISLKKREIAPKYVVDITRIAELSYIRNDHGHISIGATTTHTEIAESELIGKAAPFLAESAASIGSVQIRNSGTIGGNIANASPAADIVPPLVALDAEAHILSHDGERRVPLTRIFSGPYRTTLSAKEFLGSVSFKRIPPGTGTCFLKVGRRRALAVARINVAVALVLERDGHIQEARICPGAVIPIPSRISQAEEVLLGSRAGNELFQKAGRIVAQEVVRNAGRRYSTPYKEPVVEKLVQRALSIAAERCYPE